MLAEWALFCVIDRDAETPSSKISRLTGGWLASETVPSSAEDGDDATESSDSRANGRAARRERRRGGADAAVEEEAAPASATDAPQPKSRRELRRAATEEAAPAAAVPAVSESGDVESAADAKPKRSRFRRLAQKSPPSSPVKEKLSLKGRLAAARGGWSADTHKEEAADTERERAVDGDSDSEHSDKPSQPASSRGSMPASRQGSLPGFPSKPRSILALQRAASSVVAMARPRRGAELADRNALSEFGRATVYVCVSRDWVVPRLVEPR